jgi:hypothetical protein
MQIGFKHLFTTKCTQLGATWSYHRVRTTTRLTWLIPLSTPDSRTKRSSAQRWRDTNLKGHGTVLYSVDAETQKNSGVSMAPKMTTYSNRCCLCVEIGIGIRKQYLRSGGQAISATDIVIINIILTIEKKNNSRQWKVESPIQKQSVP